MLLYWSLLESSLDNSNVKVDVINAIKVKIFHVAIENTSQTNISS